MMTGIIAIVATLNVIMLLRVLHNGRRKRRALIERIDKIEIARIHRPRGRR
ncbi:hypothetical protein [Sphingomonas sp. MMS24-J13]|uniref:hypothetical protein n=1 Tax=Sphingomonas sp. MMS24-J13 TaxID=3238686 RepID=UPI00384CABAC